MRNNSNPQQITLFDSINYSSCAGGGDTKCFVHKYDNIITHETILRAWKEFLRGKKNKLDVIDFRLNLVDNIDQLFQDLSLRRYNHGQYTHFKITDPKARDIHKSPVRDRIVHHLLYTTLQTYFDKKFIYDSYSCRIGKGTHRAIRRFDSLANKASLNNTRICWVLKCDIRKFFASIDHKILKKILDRYIKDKEFLQLIFNIIDSFHTSELSCTGLPLGNLTSQLLVNVYMNEFDQYMKHTLKVNYYIRYADDFVIISDNKDYLEHLIPKISEFLDTNLKLNLHPKKVFIKTVGSGVDFLGWVVFPNHKVLRRSTKRRMLKKINKTQEISVVTSYKGMIKHGSAYKLEKQINSLLKL